VLLRNLGFAYNELGECLEAQKRLERAAHIVETHFNGFHPDLATILSELGYSYTRLGNETKAIAVLKQAFVLVDPKTANLGWEMILSSSKLLDQAEREFPNISIVLSKLRKAQLRHTVPKEN
jgi:tetratricopeptide (TPR) repeat protein